MLYKLYDRTDLFVEVEEALGAVDVVEGGAAGHPAVDAHGVDTQRALRRHEQPVGVGATHKHLYRGKQTSDSGTDHTQTPVGRKQTSDGGTDNTQTPVGKKTDIWWHRQHTNTCREENRHMVAQTTHRHL